MERTERMQREMRAILVSAACFLIGALAGTIALWGNPRPLAGDGSVGVPASLIAGTVAAASFVVSTVMHRRGETKPMPLWQRVVSDLSAIALTIAFASVTALGVLLAGEILGVGLRGVELLPIGGGLLTGVAAAVGGRLSFGAGIGVTTDDLAGLLSGYLVIGTLFAMLTAADPRWWEFNFSQLGAGTRGWAFNGTVLVGGLLIATVGAYIGRDIHRLRGDAAFLPVAAVVLLWAGAGTALACVGIFPAERAIVAHNISAVATLVLFLVAAIVTTVATPGRPAPLMVTTAAVGILLVAAFVLYDPLELYSLTVMEAIAVGLGLLWMTTLARVLMALAPDVSRPSLRPRLFARPRLRRRARLLRRAR